MTEPSAHQPRRAIYRPPSLLTQEMPSVPEIIGGLVSAGVIGGGILFMVILFRAGALAIDLSTEPDPIDEAEVIPAQFVQLGRDFQEELPNRDVPVQNTAPDDRTAISENPQDHEPPPDAGVRPPDPMDDPMQRLVDRADLFAEIAEQQEMEGDPDGIEGGTTNQEGDRYAGQLYAFFRRGWSVPTTIDADEQRELRVEVSIDVSEDLELVDFRLRGSSSNPDFDQSVIAQLERLRAANATIPEPPIAMRPQYIDQWFTLRFRGRDAR
ncbi:MAG: TonB C-terminal domain-containing protein [Deltaproteobacteria bacterium]|nr:TonB C-terminal domain-containing protein [Deltaproteobacteria bacterium]